ncbi:MAG TPA: chemotaxis protein CheW [Xenococcaceae cyanobacterium]
MMKQHSYLIFRINHSLYGINTYSVQEIFLLPELTQIPEAPPGIGGVIDVRGYILPVMDLNLRFGQQKAQYSLTDQVILVEEGEHKMGIIVDEVYEVRNISETDITREIGYSQQSPDTNSEGFIAGVVRSENDILVIINLANLLQYVSKSNEGVKPNYLEQQVPLVGLLSSSDGATQGQLINRDTKRTDDHQLTVSFPSSPQSQLTSEALTILRERANRLRQATTVRQDSQNLKNLAIVALNNELFSVDLENVREFTNIEQVVPVPCCPPHIIGNMNLRGEILTLVDICRLLNLPPMNLTKVSQLMVVEVAELRVGLTIEKVYDTIVVDAQEIDLVPAANYGTNREYFHGTLSYQEKMVSILDVVKILQNGNLIVDQAG